MTVQELKSRDFNKELIFSASRSGGPGGQNVNKVNTKVELRFNIHDSNLLSDGEKGILQYQLSNKINSDGDFILTSSTERSQLKNKLMVIERFYLIIANALTPKKKRKPSKRTKASIEKRLTNKRHKSEKKANRRMDY